MIKTNLAQAIDATNDSGSAYDTNIKHLLADKQILSRILKYKMEEFRNMELTDIMGCIGDDIEIGTDHLIQESWDTIWKTGWYSILQE